MWHPPVDMWTTPLSLDTYGMSVVVSPNYKTDMFSLFHDVAAKIAIGLTGVALFFTGGSATSRPIPQPVVNQPVQTQSQQLAPTLSNDSYYTNSIGNTVHSPAYSNDGSVPAGATAQCGDSTYSFSQHRSGTCSHHGGVATWLNDNGNDRVASCQAQAETAKENFLTTEFAQIGASKEYNIESYAQFLQDLQANIQKDNPESVAGSIAFLTQGYEEASALAAQKKQDAINNTESLAQLKYDTLYSDCLNQ
jgi:hypothetical protein